MFLSLYRQLNLLSTATPAIGAWLVPIDQLKSSLRKLDMEGTLRICAVMGCIMTEALEVSWSTCRARHIIAHEECFALRATKMKNNFLLKHSLKVFPLLFFLRKRAFTFQSGVNTTG